MAHWLRVRIIFCVVLLGMASTSLCKANVQHTVDLQIDAAAIQQDPRLEKPVTLSARRISLKEVLDQFAAQTGITLTINERDPSSGYPVMVECSQVPVGKMLNALYGLFSIRGSEWVWMRSGKAGAYQYAFHETVNAKNRTAIYDRILKELMTNYVAVMRRLAPMTMTERKKHRAELKKATFLENEMWLNTFFEEESFWTEANFFFNALTREEQETVLRGGRISVVLKTLPASVSALYHQRFVQINAHQVNEEGEKVLTPEPDVVQVFQSGPGRPQRQLAPLIQATLETDPITSGTASMSWMATGYLDSGVRDALKHAWLLHGDKLTSPAGQTIVTEPKETDAIRAEKAKLKAATEKRLQFMPEQFRLRHPNAFSRPPLDFTLAQLSQGSGIPLLAILPTGQQDNSDTPVGKSVQQYLDRIEGNAKNYFYKWRDGVVLVSDPFWFTEPVEVIPYSLLATLHPDLQGRIPLPELANLMSKISEDQAQWLAAETGMHDSKILRLCLLLIASERRVLRKEGVNLAPDVAQYLKSAVFPSASLRPNAQTLFRIREDRDKKSEDTSSSLYLEVQKADQKKWTTLSFLSLPVFQEGLLRRRNAENGTPR